MLPLWEKGKYGKLDYFIIDECDSIMLDDAELFLQRYTSLKKKVGGLFFLTATQFEETSEGESHEKQFVSNLKMLLAVRCTPQKTIEWEDPYEMKFENTEAMVKIILKVC